METSRRSIVRRTRSQTRAAAMAEVGDNLQISGRHETASVAAAEDDFEASMIDDDHGDENDCGGCDRPNNAERYMVQCKNCSRWYHFSCARVDRTTVHSLDFSCVKCAPRTTVQTSEIGRSSTSSARAQRLARELQRLEEEKKLEKEFLARKYDLLKQADASERASEGKSQRSVSITPSNRVAEWLQSHGNAGKPPGVAGDSTETATAGDVSILPYPTSTPIGEEGAAGGGDAINYLQQISPVNIQNLWPELGDTPRVAKLGVHRKPPPAEYGAQNKRTTDLEEQLEQEKALHAKDAELRDKREGNLLQKLCEMQEKMELQQQREADLQRQLTRMQDQQAAEARKAKMRELAEQQRSSMSGKQNVTELQPINAFTRVVQLDQRLLADAGEVPLAPGNDPKQVPPPVSTPKPSAPLHYERNPSIAPHSLQSRMGNCSNISSAIVPSFAPVNQWSEPVTNNQPYAPPMNNTLNYNPSLNYSPVNNHVVPPHQQPLDAPQTIHAPNGEQSAIPPQDGPTRLQLAARHVVPKELPSFDGKAEDWPAFISSYHHSTQVCGFSNLENMLRLQKALKDPARREVSYLLNHPHAVPQVIWALQIRYGQPDQIVQKLIEQVTNIPPPKPGQPSQMVSYGLMVQNLCGHLRGMEMHDHLANPILLRSLVAKLPEAVKLNWALYREQLPVVNLSNFGDYMARIAYAMSNLPTEPGTDAKSARNDRSKAKDKAFVNAHAAVDEPPKVDEARGSRQPAKQPSPMVKKAENSCLICGGGNHRVDTCSTFKKLDFAGRWKEVKERKLCGRCLTQHSRYPCRGQECGIDGCKKRHHKLLHHDVPEEEKSKDATASGVVSVHRQSTSSTLFRMLPVTLYGSKGKVNTYAFLDDGSSITMVERSLADAIGLDGEPDSLCIHWTGGVQKKIQNTRSVKLEVSAVDNRKRFKAAEAYVVDNLGLPEQTIRFEEMEQRFDYLRGLPVESFTAATPGILIGLNNIHLLSALKLREGGVGEPIATKTRLGWTVYGSLQGDGAAIPHRQMHIQACTADDELHEYVREFFTLESLGVALLPTVESSADQRARETLEETTMRTETGRFQTGLLWKSDAVSFPNSEPMAEKRFKHLEKRLSKDPQLYDSVRRIIAEMQEKGYSHKATAEEMAKFERSRMWFLPIGVVLNPKKPGKVRIIWDAAATVNGISLNTELLCGPDLLVPLLMVLFGFREREVAICGDIMEMFHQILIRQEDRCAQLYKWRDSPDQPLETMVMDVAIFGAKCSPTLSQFVKDKNADEHEEEYPQAAKAIKANTYVDDLAKSFDTEEEAVELALEIAKVHAAGGFYIRNWISNSRAVLERIGESNPASVKRLVGEGSVERLLGIVWDPEADVLSFVLNVRDDMQALVEGVTAPTKRDMLRVVMSIYDPCGLVSAFVVHGKILVQDVWRANVTWDVTIPSDVFDRWKQWLTVLRKMGDVKIPRCYFPGYDPESLQSVQLHVFVDASEQAYAACAYFRIVDRGQVRCALVASKTKVAPLKPLSIPRLELLAMVLGVRLRKTIVSQHTLKISRTYFWSDSSTVLLWIKSDARRYRPYVGMRLTEILDDAKVEEFRWVPTSLNVADEATKWGKGPSFDDDSRWTQAPRFLYEEENEWPKDCREKAVEPPEEIRPSFVGRHSVVKSTLEMTRFSKWKSLLRCVSYVQRYIDNCRRKIKKEPLELGADLTSEELSKGERTIWRIVQSEAYPDEVATLKQNVQPGATKKKLPNTSALAKTTPVVDEFGVLRVDTRIAACEYATYDNINPIILPRNHRATYLLLDSYHRAFRHANDETVTNEVRQRFHITQLKVAVKATRKRCMFCRVEKPARLQPRMGPLPKARLTPHQRAFTYVGIDYFGPYLVKQGRSAVKRWVALFTCLTTRAIHLEVVSSLSTDSCKKAIRRFIACRGAPAEIYSDRGTNFIGAARELRKEIKRINVGLSSTFTDANTQWKFNPPAAPHMGGCWERMVRSVKVALGCLPIVRKLDEESLLTLLKEAQHMINTRPLTIVPLETADHEALTPNHFLLLSSNGVKQPEKDPVDAGMALRGSWNQIQHTLDIFWRRWLKEYMPTIARRTKWFGNVRSIRVGDLVVIADAGVRNRWIRAIVVKTYPGQDGEPRRADVRTSSGVVLTDRAVCNLALLDVANDGDADT